MLREWCDDREPRSGQLSGNHRSAGTGVQSPETEVNTWDFANPAGDPSQAATDPSSLFIQSIWLLPSTARAEGTAIEDEDENFGGVARKSREKEFTLFGRI
jgi:hypothetical protein